MPDGLRPLGQSHRLETSSTGQSANDSIVSSPVRSLLASMNKRVRPYSRGRKRKATRMANIKSITSSSSTAQFPDPDVYCMMSTTNWVEVVFLKTGQISADPCHVQGGRKEPVGVTIIPEWRPPSPRNNICVASSCTLESRSPKRLLQTPLIRSSLSDSQGEDESDLSDEHDVSLQTSHVNSDNRSVYSMLLTPQSPLATSNIKSLVCSEKFSSLPILSRNKLIEQLPQYDRDSIFMNEPKSLDSALNNEYISVALREWQDRLAMGTLHNKRNLTLSNTIPSWKDQFYEDVWGEKSEKFVNNSGVYYPCSENYSEQQNLVYKTLFTSTPRLPNHSTSSLPIQLPRQHYNALHHTRQQILQEHSYCKPQAETNTTLPVTMMSHCVCFRAPLKICVICHKLYHGQCTLNNMCPSCTKKN